uniref:EF-hand domain-containing protein n=2 Tax=Phytophthora ramorum TaxID=164328 RepID=H3GX84_PHYRM
MRLSYILLVAVATLFASVDAAVESKQVQLSQMTTANRIESEPDSRLLRAEVDGQERRLQSKYSLTYIKQLVNDKQFRNNNFQSWKDLSVSDITLAKSLSLKTGPYTDRFKWIEKIMNLNKADRLKLLEDYRAFIKPNAAGIACLEVLVWVFVSFNLKLRCVHATNVADDWYVSTRCTEGSSSTACRNYERCQVTHRCARGDEDYEIKDASLKSFTRQFGGGDREQIALMNDFEDWKSGTHHWRFGNATNSSSIEDSMLEPRAWIGWDTFTFPVIGSLELEAGYLVFDTDRAELRGDVQLSGVVATTRLGGTSVAVFNFMTVYLGAGVRVRFQGNRAVAILSRSSFIVDTELRVRPGTLGGFPGGGFIGAGTTYPGVNNNKNGPGSTSARVYVKTLSTWGKHVSEVQEIETSVASGQNLQGHFILRYPSTASAGLTTETIAYDATALDVRRRLETAFPDIGELHVERDDTLEQVPEIGRLWRVTFLSAVGNVPQLQAQNFLSGLEAKAATRTIVDGNELSGSFRLSFLGDSTRWLAHDVTAEQLRSSLLTDLATLIDARVTRTDAKGRCVQGSTLDDQTASSSIEALDPNYDQGLYRASEWLTPEDDLVEVADSTKNYPAKRCRAGRGAAGGFVWKLQFWTREGNVVPMTPTSSTKTDVAAPAVLQVDFSQLKGVDAVAEIVDSQYFSLAFGGAGASFASPGGVGYTGDSAWVAPAYADELVTDLLGGSGGAGGGQEPFDVFPVVQPTQGGAGAGAIMLSAINDVLIGPNAVISANGGAGSSAFTPGGGGSGGSVLLLSVDMEAMSLLLEASVEEVAVAADVSPFTLKATRLGAKEVCSKPTRVSYFVRVGNLERGTLAVNRGAIFGVHRSDAAPANDAIMIAIALVDGSFAHEANTFQWPRHIFHDKVQTDRWYKLDMTLDWNTHTYSIRLNDVLKVAGAAFQGKSVAALSLNNFHAMSTWWDEIYVGKDFLLGFSCPWIRNVPDTAAADAASENEGAVLTAKRTWRKLWAESSQKPTTTTYHPMVHHDSHLPRQEVYKHDNNGIVPFDGAPHRAFFNDVREQESEIPDQSSYEEQQAESLTGNEGEEVISYAELLTIEGLPLDSFIVEPLETGIDWEAEVGASSASSPSPEPNAPQHPSVYWYSEVFDANTGRGGIGACSSIDYNEWRNEGLMLHFTNLTDPFGDRQEDNGGLLADRPKVVFNRATKRFVMWMHVDSASSSAANTMGLTGVASSEYPNGPFSFVRSLYPDAAPLEAPGGQSVNETHDQTVAILASSSGEDAAYLVRTYYKTVEYWLPRPVMDPLWQSVQKPSTAKDGGTVTDFGLSYHRAFHHMGYDDPTDIYLQRWRMEDTPWEVICCSLVNATNCVSVTTVPQKPEDVCPDGMKKKVILGQAQTQSANATTTAVVETRYKDPNDDANSAFIPTASVPAYTSWGFQVQNTKTWRGNYFDALSTNITLFIFKRFAGERRRHEIEDDPAIEYVYPNEEELTENTIPSNDTEILDELLGTLGVPVSLAFKSKYSSFDLAEIDRDSDGKITSYEIAQLEEQKALKKLTAELVDALIADFNLMKWNQVDMMDANKDGVITFKEFDNWLGVDPNLLFDRFDLDKSGYLDENELARALWYRQMPRLDAAIFVLDPSFDGRVYYERFRSLLLQAPDYVFKSYDFDSSGSLSQVEIDLMAKDLGSALARPEVLAALINSSTNSITKADYAAWFSSTTSLVDDARNKLKVDNAVHATGPDRLTGPLYVVERRRAKYVAISALTDDYLGTRGLLREVEGDFEGREALLNFFAFSEDLFGLADSADGAVLGDEIRPFREFLSPAMLRERASYWNGRHWEGRPSAPPLFTYGSQCFQVAGLVGTTLDEQESGCLPCRTTSPYASDVVDQYQTFARGSAHCQPQKELDAYVKAFDQQVSIQLQYQQQAQLGPQGLQPHMSPCYNQSQFFPCDVHKVLDGDVADTLGNWTARETAQSLAWEKHPNNIGSSVKIRADDYQFESKGPSYIERFPHRQREPLNGAAPLNSSTTYEPDELADVLGGGR